jgi:sialidase-1
MARNGLLLAMVLAAPTWAQEGGFVVKDLPLPGRYGDPIIREDFERCEPAGAVVMDERRPDTWLLRTRDWPSPLLNAMGNPPDLTYDPGLTGVYDIHLGSRSTDFPVSVGVRLSSEKELTVVSSPRATPVVHEDWEFCLRRWVRLDGEKIVLHATGDMAYVDYLKFVPHLGGTQRARVATDQVMIASAPGRHFAFPGAARLPDGTLVVVFREGNGHISDDGSVALVRSTDGGRTWSPRTTIYDDPARDERDPGVVCAPEGTLVVSLHSGGAMTMRSTDGGLTWDAPTPAPVFSPHGPGVLPDGRLYWCGIVTRFGMNCVETHTSSDLGRTWQLQETCGLSLPYHWPWVGPFWDEPHAVPLPGGRWLALHRVDRDGYLYANHRDGEGAQYTVPLRTGLWGCPPYLLPLADGRLLALYGYRREPFGIRACASSDGGATWDPEQELVLRDDGGHVDLGYPVALELEPGLVLAVYYFNHGGGECSIEGTFLRP